MARNFRIDHAGVAEFLRSESGIFDMIEEGTAEAAEIAREDYPQGFLILNGVLITDRPQGNITVVNRSAEAIEGKYGYLRRAAREAGFH